jgi:hypothetical protein
MKIILKKIVFTIHIIGIFITLFGWIYIPHITFIQPIVFLSWYFNNNKCIISQVEYYLFKSTFIGNRQKYYVPTIQRYLLYTMFILSLFYNFII